MNTIFRFSSCAALVAVSLGSPTLVRAQDSATIKAANAAPTKLVSVNVSNQSLNDTLISLFNQAGVSFTFASNLPQTNSVTVSLKDMPFETALRTVLTTANSHLTYTVENGIYRIQPQTDTTATAGNPHNYDTIPLSYVNAQTVLDKIRALSGASGSTNYGGGGYSGGYTGSSYSSSITGSGLGVSSGLPDGVDSIVTNEQNNSLVVRSTPEGLERLRSIVKLFDIPMTAPRNLSRPMGQGGFSSPLGDMNGGGTGLAAPARGLTLPGPTDPAGGFNPPGPGVAPTRSRPTRATRARVPVRKPRPAGSTPLPTPAP